LKVITELTLRELSREQPFTTYTLPPGARLTPAATQFLQDFRVELVHARQSEVQQPQGQAIAKANTELREYEITKGQGKPAHLACLQGDRFVNKHHPRIIFRCKMDLFESQVISATVEAEAVGLGALGTELKHLLDICRIISKVEINEDPLPDISFGRWSEEEIQERAHDTEKYYGIKEFLPLPSHGRVMAVLNQLRAVCRDLEIAAVTAFFTDEKIEREDILKVLDTASNYICIMMYRLLAGEYQCGIGNGD